MTDTPLYVLMRQYRVIPIIASAVWMYLLLTCFNWYISLPNPSVEQSGFAATMVATSAAWFKFYVQSGSLDKSIAVE